MAGAVYVPLFCSVPCLSPLPPGALALPLLHALRARCMHGYVTRLFSMNSAGASLFGVLLLLPASLS
jgi:hypothetical protein